MKVGTTNTGRGSSLMTQRRNSLKTLTPIQEGRPAASTTGMMASSLSSPPHIGSNNNKRIRAVRWMRYLLVYVAPLLVITSVLFLLNGEAGVHYSFELGQQPLRSLTALCKKVHQITNSTTSLQLEDNEPWHDKSGPEGCADDDDNDDHEYAKYHKNMTEDSFGGCLLIKDDNHWLIEWLAFHYHVLPLRHLIVVIDPNSQTSPMPILHRWTKSKLMTITIWEDSDFMLSTNTYALKRKYGSNEQHMMFVLRQVSFYKKCMQQLQARGVPWVALTDTDEFLSLNYNVDTSRNKNYSNVDVSTAWNNNSDTSKQPTRAVTQALMQQHPIEEPGSVLNFLNHRKNLTQKYQRCIYANRYYVGTESEAGSVNLQQPQSNTTTTSPKGNAAHFLTQQYTRRTQKATSYGKNLMHLAALSAKNVRPLQNPHRISEHCPRPIFADRRPSTAFFKIHHHIGTSDQFFYRKDPRSDMIMQEADNNATAKVPQRDINQYNRVNAQATFRDKTQQPWILGFVQDVGFDTAQYLIRGVGKLQPKKATTPKTATTRKAKGTAKKQAIKKKTTGASGTIRVAKKQT